MSLFLAVENFAEDHANCRVSPKRQVLNPNEVKKCFVKGKVLSGEAMKNVIGHVSVIFGSEPLRRLAKKFVPNSIYLASSKRDLFI